MLSAGLENNCWFNEIRFVTVGHIFPYLSRLHLSTCRRDRLSCVMSCPWLPVIVSLTLRQRCRRGSVPGFTRVIYKYSRVTDSLIEGLARPSRTDTFSVCVNSAQCFHLARGNVTDVYCSRFRRRRWFLRLSESVTEPRQ